MACLCLQPRGDAVIDGRIRGCIVPGVRVDEEEGEQGVCDRPLD